MTSKIDREVEFYQLKPIYFHKYKLSVPTMPTGRLTATARHIKFRKFTSYTDGHKMFPKWRMLTDEMPAVVNYYYRQ